MNQQRWFIVLSPDGAARTVSSDIFRAFSMRLAENCKSFDSLQYRHSFSNLLRLQDDALIVDLINQSLAVSCLDFGATHVLVNALAPVTLFSLNLLRRYGIKTVHWFYEDHRRAPYWLDVVRGYDLFCAIQHGPIPEACRKAGAAFHFLPTACCTADLKLPRKGRGRDVAFVGIPSRYRIAVLESLARRGIGLAIAGSGWNAYSGPLQNMIVNNQWTTREQAVTLLAESKIGINLSVDEPREPEHAHISPRVFEVLASGCLLVTEDVPLLAESVPGAVCHTFGAAEAAGPLIEKLLREYGGLAEEIERNRALIYEKHTYRCRADELIAAAGT